MYELVRESSEGEIERERLVTGRTFQTGTTVQRRKDVRGPFTVSSGQGAAYRNGERETETEV